MKNVLVVKTSPRKGGNSDRLVDEFIKAAIEVGRVFNKRVLALSLICVLSFAISSCNKEDSFEEIEAPEETTDDNPTDNPSEDNMNNRQISILIGTDAFTATLEDNAAGKAFLDLLPLTMQMKELGGNEKYHYLSSNLPVSSYAPETIHEGDLMLYGTSCIVLFYQTFVSSYSYTRIGKVDNPEGLATAVGSGDVTITFDKIEKFFSKYLE